MKLAEALMTRSDLQKKLSELEKRILMNNKIQEGDSPSENPVDLVKIYRDTHRQLVELVKKILQTNSKTFLESGESIADLIIERDFIQKERVALSLFASDSAEKDIRYSSSEIKILSLLDASELQKEADFLSKKFRELDIKIQSANWQTDLME